jgi:hypothetical protein
VRSINLAGRIKTLSLPWSGCLALAPVLASLLVPAWAAAQDSEAPPGAGTRWLPCERWVMLHWVPYDERRLFRMLRISREQARAWITDDEHHTFAQLARRRGLDPENVAARLVASWTRGAGEARRAVLKERALRTLTQGHLSQHVFFHVFHHPEVGARAASVFHTSPMHYYFLRHAGYTPGEIAAIGGRSRAAAASAIARVWRATSRRGAREGETPSVQARRFAVHQLAVLQQYLDSSISSKDPGPPPAPSQLSTPEPHLRLLCTIFAGRWRAAHPENYGDDAWQLSSPSPARLNSQTLRRSPRWLRMTQTLTI